MLAKSEPNSLHGNIQGVSKTGAFAANMPDGIRRGRKYDQVLIGARDVFLVHGYEAASVDEIARASGVSKATLYSYFPDKQHLFIEVVRSECNRQADAAVEVIAPDAPASVVLEQVARHILAFVLSDFAQAVFRVCVSEAERFPELGRAFYESGPRLGHLRLVAWMQSAVAEGKLAIDDVPLAADQFAELCKASLWTKSFFGIQTRFSKAEVDHVIHGAVATFLARYGN